MATIQPIQQTSANGLINAPNTVAAQTQNIAPIQPKTWDVAGNQLVQNQVKDIVAADSPLMQQAASGAMQQAAKRGLMGSSIAVGAAQDSVIRNALPIALQDAQTFSAAGQTNSTEANKTAMFNTELGTKNDQFNIGEQNRLKLQDITNANQLTIEQSKGASGLYDTYQRTISAILTNPDMTQESKQKAVDIQLSMMSSGMSMYSDVEGLGISSMLDFASASNIMQGGQGAVNAGGALETIGVTATDRAKVDAAAIKARDLLQRQAEWDEKKKAILATPTLPKSYTSGIMNTPSMSIALLGPRPTV